MWKVAVVAASLLATAVPARAAAPECAVPLTSRHVWSTAVSWKTLFSSVWDRSADVISASRFTRDPVTGIEYCQPLPEGYFARYTSSFELPAGAYLTVDAIADNLAHITMKSPDGVVLDAPVGDVTHLQTTVYAPAGTIQIVIDHYDLGGPSGMMLSIRDQFDSVVKNTSGDGTWTAELMPIQD